MTIQAIYENGVFRPLQAVSLGERQSVRLQVECDLPAKGIKEILRAAGHLTELSPETLAALPLAEIDIQEVRRLLAQAGGKPLSAIVLDQRGPRQ